MHRAIDVANWFLSKQSMTHKKIQKLCYYAQGWHCALLGEALFQDRIEAWVHGPVIPNLYPSFADYRWMEVPKLDKLPSHISFCDDTLELLDAVFKTYGKFTGDQLEYLSHREQPWIEARGNLEPWETCTKEITHEALKKYFTRLYEEGQND